MGLVKKSWIAPGLAMLLSSALYAEGAYTVTTSSLSEAIEQISEISKKPYIVDARILEGKKANPITGIENLEKALELLLEGSGLEAVIQSDTIVIRSQRGEPAMLNTISIAEPLLSENTEETHSYTTPRMRTATKLGLSIRETPQSVTVLTQQRLEDMGVTSYQDMLGSVAGISLNRWDERIYPTARGFEVDYYLIDGMPTYNISDSTAGDVDLSLYDRVEVVKGANGLMTGAGNPGVGLNFIRKHANSKTFKGDMEVSAGSWDAYGYLADVSAPLNKEGTIRGRLIAKHEDKNSFMDGYQKSNNVVYGVVDMDLTETTYLSLAGEYQRLERDGI
ncbi:MAG: TonB-dependent siderophore receptor, partial [Wolinella sp.]